MALYEHTRESLLPLLEHHLPASILVYGAIVAPSPPSPYQHTSKLWSNIPIPVDGSPVPIDVEGTIIADLPPFSGGQIRLFDTFEPKGGAIDNLELENGISRIVKAIKDYAVIDPELQRVGGLHERWVEAVVDRIGNGTIPPPLSIWLPGDRWAYSETSGSEGQQNGSSRNIDGIEGYRVDMGRTEDIEGYSAGSDIDRDPGYYASRLPWSTVIRPISPPSTLPSSIPSTTPDINPPASLILTHADGSLGSLTTNINHRRKGLAQWIVKEHLSSGRGLVGGPNYGTKGKLTYAVVFDRNIASQKMFASLGWEERWKCAWVAIDLTEKGDEMRSRSREVLEMKRELEGSDLASKNTLEGR